MKTFPIIQVLLLTVIVAAGQDKIKARVSIQYNKIMGQESFLSFSAKYKGEKSIEASPGLVFHIYQVSEDSLNHLGTTTTNEKGSAKFILNINRDSTQKKHSDYEFVIKIENDKTFADAESVLKILDANLVAHLEMVDSVNQIAATLSDVFGQPLSGQSLKVQLQRMFAPLTIGEESYETDENGSIAVSIEDQMPGIDGNLTFEVVLNESEEYGTVKTLVTAPIGTPITDQSTFDKRTMWSPPTKTPGYLLIFPNLIILGVWVPILLLVFNLYRISKSKTNSL